MEEVCRIFGELYRVAAGTWDGEDLHAGSCEATVDDGLVVRRPGETAVRAALVIDELLRLVAVQVDGPDGAGGLSGVFYDRQVGTVRRPDGLIGGFQGRGEWQSFGRRGLPD